MGREAASIRDLPAVGTMAANIALFYRAEAAGTWDDAGAAWYGRANQEARRLGVGVRRGAGIIAALSPRTPWGRNVELARMAARGVTALPTTRNATRAARRVLDLPERPALEDLDRAVAADGPKVRAFARAILGDLDAVCVDVWALRVAVGVPFGGRCPWVAPTSAAYGLVARAYRLAARRLGIPARDLQAATWCAIRGSAA